MQGEDVGGRNRKKHIYSTQKILAHHGEQLAQQGISMVCNLEKGELSEKSRALWLRKGIGIQIRLNVIWGEEIGGRDRKKHNLVERVKQRWVKIEMEREIQDKKRREWEGKKETREDMVRKEDR